MQNWIYEGTYTSQDWHALHKMCMVCEQASTGLSSIIPTITLSTVCAAELVAHRDRLSRHSRAIVAAITDIKATAQAAPDSMKAQVITHYVYHYAIHTLNGDGCVGGGVCRGNGVSRTVSDRNRQYRGVSEYSSILTD